MTEHGTTVRTALARGLVRHCPACGSGGLFTSWFRMRDRCPQCDYVFAREVGFGLGAIFMNFAVTEFLLAVCCIVPLIAALAANPEADVTPIVAAGAAATVLGPIVAYPFSRTVWVALELVFRPAAAHEPADRR